MPRTAPSPRTAGNRGTCASALLSPLGDSASAGGDRGLVTGSGDWGLVDPHDADAHDADVNDGPFSADVPRGDACPPQAGLPGEYGTEEAVLEYKKKSEKKTERNQETAAFYVIHGTSPQVFLVISYCTLLLHRYFLAATLPLLLPLLCCYSAAALPLLCRYSAAILPLLCRCSAAALPLLRRCSAAALPLLCRYSAATRTKQLRSKAATPPKKNRALLKTGKKKKEKKNRARHAAAEGWQLKLS
eukprot:gene17262-biopygen3794